MITANICFVAITLKTMAVAGLFMLLLHEQESKGWKYLGRLHIMFSLINILSALNRGLSEMYKYLP